MTLQRRHLLAAAGALALSGLARAQGLPDNARIFAGFAAGGTVDVTARRIGDRLRDVVAQSVVVENRTGAGGRSPCPR
jgi:tripartite-type tricarboxylate transporter receptor subunit TctC